MRNRDLAAMAILLQIFSFGCSSKSASTQGNEQKETTAPAMVVQKAEFNTSNKDVTVNNNLTVAADKVSIEPSGSLSAKAEAVSVSKLTKSPYSAIGKIYKVTGKVYKVEELPPDLHKNGKWSELLMMANNPNSPMGSTTIDFIYHGDASDINSGQVLSCSGYFVGTFESENAMGGKVEAVTLVGNSVKQR